MNSYRKQKTVSEELNNLLEKFPIDLDKLNNSKNVHLSIYKENRYVESETDGGLLGGTHPVTDTNVSDSDSEGYLTKTLILFDYGYVNARQKRFEASTYIIFHKKFDIRRKDSLIFWCSNGVVIDFNYDYKHVGTFSYDSISNNYGTITIKPTVIRSIREVYGNGIRYDVTLPFDFGFEYDEDKYDDYANYHNGQTSRNWHFHGSYNFIAEPGFSIYSEYIHNETIFGDLSISISFSGVSISSNILGGFTRYSGTGITIYA